jgi:hypothetical protein
MVSRYPSLAIRQERGAGFAGIAARAAGIPARCQGGGIHPGPAAAGSIKTLAWPIDLMQSIAGYAPPPSDRLQDPNGDGNNDYYIQNRLDAGSHRDIVVDEPQPDTYDDQRNHDLY